MSTLGERIREVRKDAKMTQTEFGEAIGASCQTITFYENGYRNPKGTSLNMICEKFHVNKKWLTTGEGEKYAASGTIPVGKEEEIAEIVTSIMKGADDDYRLRLIKAISQMTPDQLYAFRDIMHNLANAEKK